MVTGAAKPTRPATSLLAVKMCSVFYEANERPRHATAIVAIRSKPIAPEIGAQQRLAHDFCIL